MRQIAIAAVLMSGTLLTGCNDGNPSAAGPPEPSRSGPSSAEKSGPSWTGKTIPDGTYAKTVTVADAEATGLENAPFLRTLGKDGETTYSYKIADGRWALFTLEAGAAPDQGDAGTLAYDADGNVRQISESEGCPGCVYVYDWELHGDQLSLTVVGHESGDSPEDIVLVRFITEGVFTRQS